MRGVTGDCGFTITFYKAAGLINGQKIAFNDQVLILKLVASVGKFSIFKTRLLYVSISRVEQGRGQPTWASHFLMVGQRFAGACNYTVYRYNLY